MNIPKPAPNMSLPAESRIGYVLGWQDGYRRGFRDGNPGRIKSEARSAASRENGKRGGRPRKNP